MAMLEPQDYFALIEKALETRKFPSLLYFYGDEPYLIDQAVAYIRSCVVEPATRDFNERVFEGSQANGASIREEAETLPMMASHRFILVREASELNEADWSEIQNLYMAPVDSSVLVLTSIKADRRKKNIQNLIENSTCVEFKKPYDNQIPGWIRHIAKGHGLSLSDEALGLFHRKVGPSLLEIEGEMRKLKSYLGARTEILTEDVEECVSQIREESIFEFTACLARGDRGQSLLQAAQLLDQGESEIGIVALSARHFRILLALRRGETQGLSGPRLASVAQIPPYFLNDYLKQLKSWNQSKLETALIYLANTEKALKSSPLSGAIWIENLIQKTCRLKEISQDREASLR